MPSIFDAPGVAGRLYDYLSKSFSRRDLFIDVDDIKAGFDFVKQLDTQVSQCDVMLALIGPNWLTTEDDQGRPKLHGDRDYVRIEIASALKRDIPVIPVLVDGAEMPSEDELPEDLKSLTRRHALEVRHTRFAADVDAIVSGVKACLPKRKKRWVRPLAASACLVGAVGVWFFYIWAGPAPPEPTSLTALQQPPGKQPNSFGGEAKSPPNPLENSECAASPPGPGYASSGYKYLLTKQVYAPETDLEAAVQAEYGADKDVVNFIKLVGVEIQGGDYACRNYFVKNEGKSFFSAQHRYLITRHDGVQPEGWLLIDQLGGNYLDLGRWTHASQILVRLQE